MAALRLRKLVVLTLTALSLGPAGAAVGETSAPAHRIEIVSVSQRGKPADGHALDPTLSRDGRWVAFNAYAANLDRRVRDGRNQVYLRDNRTGRMRLAVLRPGGRPAKDAEAPSLSPSGRFLAFCSKDPRLVRPDSFDPDAGLPHPDQDVFVLDLSTGELRRASTDHAGREADGYSCNPQVADTGDVVFSSRATDLVVGDTDQVPDVYLYDWSSERVRLLTKAEIGDQAFRISGDGSVVVAVTTDALVDRDDNGYTDVYAFRRSGKRLAGTWEPVLFRADGAATRTGCSFPGLSVSRTGRYVTGACADGGIADPAVPDKDVHLWLADRRENAVTLVNPTTSTDSEVAAVAVSDDGRSVVYGAADLGFGGLSPDADGEGDVFAWRRGHGVTSLTPGRRAWWSSYGLDLSGDGRTVAFTSSSPYLAGRDPEGDPLLEVFATRLP